MPSGTWPTKEEAGATATGTESTADNSQSEEDGNAVKPKWQAAQALHLASPGLAESGEESSCTSAAADRCSPSCMA